MSAHREFRPRNRLAEMIHEPGGLTIEDALRRAESNIESLHGEVAAAIDQALAKLQQAVPLGVDGADEMYRQSNEIVGFAVTRALEGDGDPCGVPGSLRGNHQRVGAELVGSGP